MTMRDGLRPLISVLALCGSAILYGCDDDDVSVTLDSENRTPLIVTESSTLSEGGSIQTGTNGPYSDEIWVLAGDPDGLDDISAVFLDIENIQINDIIIRPSIMNGSCYEVDYTPNATIDITSHITLPVVLPSPVNREALYNYPDHDGGIYSSYYEDYFDPPDIEAVSTVFGGHPGYCSQSDYIASLLSHKLSRKHESSLKR